MSPLSILLYIIEYSIHESILLVSQLITLQRELQNDMYDYYLSPLSYIESARRYSVTYQNIALNISSGNPEILASQFLTLLRVNVNYMSTCLRKWIKHLKYSVASQNILPCMVNRFISKFHSSRLWNNMLYINGIF